jgi:flagellar biosynthesis protein FlhF
MIAKTFLAENMLEALESIQKELGSEALIVSVRNVPAGPSWQVWKKPGVEVVAMPSIAEAATETAPVAVPPPPSAAKKQVELNPDFLEALKQAAAISQSELPGAPLPAQSSGTVAASASHPAQEKKSTPAALLPALPRNLSQIQDQLMEQGVEEELTRRCIRAAAETLSPRAIQNDRTVRDHVRAQLTAGLRTRGGGALPQKSSLPFGGMRVVCLIGTSGSGKTSTTSKIAALAAKSLDRKVTWISADTLRAGAIAKTRALTDPLGIPLRLAYSAKELADQSAAELGADLILVDTPGCNPHREAEVTELGSFLTSLPQRHTTMIAPATARANDLRDALAAFATFDIKSIILTKMDETRRWGDVYNFAHTCRLPIVYYTVGARVLGDLLWADADILAGALLGEGMPL